MVIWTLTTTNVDAGTIKLPRGRESPFNDSPGGAQKYGVEDEPAL